MKRRYFVLCGTAALAALPLVGCGDDDNGGNGGTGGSGTGGSGGSGGSGTGGTGGSGTGGSGGSPTGGMGGGGGAAFCTQDVEADTTVVEAHFHHVVIPLQDIIDGNAGVFTFEIAEGHTHDITLTEEDLTALRAGDAVTKTSTITESHEHDVTLSCV